MLTSAAVRAGVYSGVGRRDVGCPYHQVEIQTNLLLKWDKTISLQRTIRAMVLGLYAVGNTHSTEIKDGLNTKSMFKG
jgi:hypothetical protein